MDTLICCFFLVILNFAQLEAYVMHHQAPVVQEWKEENLPPFDELMLSWNAARPVQGKFLFYVSVKVDTWSPWLLYAAWGHEGQSSFSNQAEDAPVKVYQDALEVMEGKKATGFQIKIVAEDSSSLRSVYGLHVYTNGDRFQEDESKDLPATSISLQVPGLSQMALDHVRHKDLCSPTSTAAVTRYLSHDETIKPLPFAEQVWDAGFDIFGNWVLNVAQAASLLGRDWDCWVERLHGFNDIYNSLKQGIPVVVSVRGPLPKSAQPYAKGHLLAVIGYDALNQKVLCMDPAFQTDHETHASYELLDFVQAWNRRGNVAYFFKKKA